MFTSRTASHTKLGFIPELNQVLLRDNSTGRLELWTKSRGRALNAITLDGVELEFVREIKQACRVVDNDFNRQCAPDEIGRIYVDQSPSYVSTVELR
jgi:hypothetical protein